MNYLFSNKLKRPGFVLLGTGFVLGLVHIFIQDAPSFLNMKTLTLIDKPLMGDVGYFKIVEDNVFDEIISLLIIIGGLLAAFSKEKYEDEYISKIRLESLVWATYVNYFILIISILFLYGLPFFWILVFNMFTTLIIFLLKFNRALYKLKKQKQS